MQTFVVEARRHEDGPWARVLTVQEDLVDDIAPMVGGPGEWRVRPEGPEAEAPRAPEVKPGLPKPSKWQRVRWWFTLRFSPRARR